AAGQPATLPQGRQGTIPGRCAAGSPARPHAMKILPLGANGQAGHELRRALGSRGDLVSTTRSGRLDDGLPCETADLDVPASLPGMVERIAPGIVVNAAAYTAVDRADSAVETVFRANAEAPAALAAACAARDALLVHYSTD